MVHLKVHLSVHLRTPLRETHPKDPYKDIQEGVFEVEIKGAQEVKIK